MTLEKLECEYQLARKVAEIQSSVEIYNLLVRLGYESQDLGAQVGRDIFEKALNFCGTDICRSSDIYGVYIRHICVEYTPDTSCLSYPTIKETPGPEDLLIEDAEILLNVLKNVKFSRPNPPIDYFGYHISALRNTISMLKAGTL